jgi:hypothetical protein
MAGLDPAIHGLGDSNGSGPSCSDEETLSPPVERYRVDLVCGVDGRVKPGHDEDLRAASSVNAQPTGNLLQEAEAYVISFRSAGSGWWRSKADAASARYNFVREPRRGRNFSIWIPRNPLKSPESAKGIQGNPSLFPWFYWFSLVLFGGNSRAGCIEAACAGVGRARLDQEGPPLKSAGSSASVRISKSGLPGRRSRRWP